MGFRRLNRFEKVCMAKVFLVGKAKPDSMLIFKYLGVKSSRNALVMSPAQKLCKFS